MNLGVWRLHLEANKYRSFLPDDLRFFRNRFQCKALGDQWKIPPVKLDGLSKPLGDFMSWMTMAPTVSERAMIAIKTVASSDLEFLPFHKIDDVQYFVMNVLRCEECVDYEKSDLSLFSERIFFQSDIVEGLPPIFKCPSLWGEIFVTAKFGEMMVANGLRGAALANPSEPALPLILRNAELNCYPGLHP